MSRLDSFIRRMEAQRACLNVAAEMVRGTTGVVLELGLGNGRTYDHMRELMPEREIYVFDRRIAAHPNCIPDDAHLFLGEFADTLPTAAARLGRSVVLVHADCGSGNAETDAALAKVILPYLERLLVPGAIVLADQDSLANGWRKLPLPQGVKPDRYFMWQVPTE